MAYKWDNESLMPRTETWGLPTLFSGIIDTWSELSTVDKAILGGGTLLAGFAVHDLASRLIDGFFSNHYRMDIDYSENKWSWSMCPSDDYEDN